MHTQRILFALLGLTPVMITACSNPSSAPGTMSGTTTSSVIAAAYSPSAFFNTQTLGDTDKTPSPACFPATYLQQQLGLTGAQDTAIQALQDSLRLAIQAQLAALKAAGTLNRDSVLAIRLRFQTALMNGLANILTPTQLAQLKALLPPNGLPVPFGPGPGSGQYRRREGPDPDTILPLTPAVRDSIQLVRLEQVLAAAGDTLTASQITLIQNVQTTLDADTTLTPQARELQFQTQLQTILTPAQIAVLNTPENGERRGFRHR